MTMTFTVRNTIIRPVQRKVTVNGKRVVVSSGSGPGIPGPNQVTDTTGTNLTGYLKGNGSVVSASSTIPYSDITGGPSPYTLPVATDSVLGGVKVGGNLSIDGSGVLSVSGIGSANGVASLDGSGKLPTGQLPDLAIVDYLGSVASQSAMLALTGQQGDWCIRTDLGTTWIITGNNPAVIGSWTQLSYPTAPVTSVANKTGAITLVAGDISGLASSATTDTTNAGNITGLRFQQQFRLTTESGQPVSTSDRTAQSTLFLTPFTGNLIPLYDGTAWQYRTSSEVSLSLSGLTSGTNYDVFAFWTGSAVALELTAWTSDTTRATSLTRQDGVLVRSGALTRRYVGTIRATGTTTTEDSQRRRFVWNANNQVARPCRAVYTTSHTYNSATYRYIGGDTNQFFSYVIGEPQSVAAVVELSRNNVECSVGVGLNWTSGNPTFESLGVDGSSAHQSGKTQFQNLSAGYAFWALIQRATGGTATFCPFSLPCSGGFLLLG